MKFTVCWDPAALHRMTEIWISAADGTEVSRRFDETDRKLRRSPDTVGYPASEAMVPERAILDLALRINRPVEEILVAPAGRCRVAYTIDEADRTVTVWTVYEHFDETP